MSIFMSKIYKYVLLLYLLLRTCLIFEFSCPQTVSGSRQRSWRFVTKKNKKWFVLLPQLIHNWTFEFFRIFLWVSPISIFLCLSRKVEENISAFSMNNLMTLFKQFPLHSKLFLSFFFFSFTLAFCDVLLAFFLGTPRFSKEWLRTLMALWYRRQR